MKFTVNSTDLLSRLQIVSRVIAPKTTLPILEDILFDINSLLQLLTLTQP